MELRNSSFLPLGETDAETTMGFTQMGGPCILLPCDYFLLGKIVALLLSYINHPNAYNDQFCHLLLCLT